MFLTGESRVKLFFSIYFAKIEKLGWAGSSMVEQYPLKVLVGGSNPPRLTNVKRGRNVVRILNIN